MLFICIKIQVIDDDKPAMKEILQLPSKTQSNDKHDEFLAPVIIETTAQDISRYITFP